MTPGSELLEVIAERLNINPVPWARDLRRLAYHLKIPYDVYQQFDEEMTQRKSPTKEVLQWLVGRFPGMKFIDVVETFKKIQCSHAI